MDAESSKQQVAREILDEQFVLSESLPKDVALNIVQDGLPPGLRAKPTTIYESPEVPLELSEELRRDLLSRIRATDSADLRARVEALLRESDKAP
jgi:hypothetical protein